MKMFKKINIGLVLTIIVVLAVIVYSISVEAQRKNSKEEIRKTCEEYISLVDKYMVLPEDAQQLGAEAKNINIDNYKNNMVNDLKGVMVSEQAAEIQKTIITDITEKDLLNTSNFATNYDRKITKIKSYEFDGNQVTVVFESKITSKQKYLDVNPENGEKKERVKENSSDVKGDTITLEKKDGKWKVVYSNLTYGFDNYTNVM